MVKLIEAEEFPTGRNTPILPTPLVAGEGAPEEDTDKIRKPETSVFVQDTAHFRDDTEGASSSYCGSPPDTHVGIVPVLGE